MATEELPYIDMGSLRVGMWIHLELGWLQHPFPLSRFRLESMEQIQKLRNLGLTRVRWDPSKSGSEPALQASKGGASEAELNPFDHTREVRQKALVADRDAVAVCEGQFREAAAIYRKVVDRLTTDPTDAGEIALALTVALADRVAPERDLCIRLLPGTGAIGLPEHSVNVGVLSLLLGRGLRWQRSELLDVGLGALMHDIGKTQSEATQHSALFEHVKRGVEAGHRMGLCNAALQVIAEHHGLPDRTGLPQELRTEAVAAAARIVALANHYDNLCNPESPAAALPPHEALVELLKQYRDRQDAGAVSALVAVLGIYPAGSVVQLTDGRYALVVAVNSGRTVAPRVLVHDPTVPPDEAIFLDLERTGGIGIRRALRPQALPAASFEYLRPVRRLTYFVEAPSPRETSGDAID